jgi:hypothetical protein
MSIVQNGLYFLKSSYKTIVELAGGHFSDQKLRPVVALLPSNFDISIFWAIPLGNYDHRNDAQKKRIQFFLNCPSYDIRSCFYHVGNTDKKSIFFISDIIPITLSEIERQYLVGKFGHYVIKNNNLKNELQRKLRRILSFEQSKLESTGHYYFRQNIFGVYESLKRKRVTQLISEAKELQLTDDQNAENTGLEQAEKPSVLAKLDKAQAQLDKSQGGQTIVRTHETGRER